MNEKLLIKQLQAQDPNALRKLISSYEGYVCTIIHNIGRSSLTESDAEEIAADVFLTVWQNGDKLQSGKLKPYIAAIARNSTKSRMRSMHLCDELDSESLMETTDLQADVEHSLLAEALKDAIDSLPKKDSEVLMRYYYYYQQTAEIADEMGLSADAVKVRLHRARKKLKTLLLERGYTYET